MNAVEFTDGRVDTVDLGAGCGAFVVGIKFPTAWIYGPFKDSDIAAEVVVDARALGFTTRVGVVCESVQS